jgi:hypothetical protein
MSNTSYIVFFALVILSILYGLEDRRSFDGLGFSAASKIAVAAKFGHGRWPLGLAALGFALSLLRRRYLRRGRDDHV